jgi:hypothetical protein
VRALEEKVVILQPLLRDNGMKFKIKTTKLQQNGNKNQIAARWS